jgi:heme o synthase
MAIVATASSAPAVLTSDRRLTASFRWLSLVAAVLIALSLVAQGLARLALPTGGVEESLLGMSLAAVVATLAASIVAWLAYRHSTGVLLIATLAVIGGALRLVAPALLSSLDLPTLSDFVDGGLGLLTLGLLVWATLSTWLPEASPIADTADGYFRRVVDVTLLVVFAANLSGLAVQAAGATWACRGFPSCNGYGLLPFGRDPLADIQLYHRLLAYAASLLVLWLAVEAWRQQRGGLGRASLALAGLTLGQGALGAASVSLELPLVAQVLHAVGSVATWSATVSLAVLAHRTWTAPALPSRQQLSAYVQLTKPKVMSLLLATTACAMVIAARGMPPLNVLLATLLGGGLMAGGAGAINHYVDRDIDPLMGRTAWRPIPSGVIAPRDALWFGITLAVLATLVLLVFVNPLATALSLLGLLGYVFIYTLWLKRSTPSNIVIGGAAGAIPPMVGWAAVTNEIGTLTAWYLFAIIFFWTPPHFWALSLLIRQHYERAGVPMLPVVRGEAETRRQIVLYSLQLVALTLLLSPFGLMGVPFFGAAVVLGAIFIAYAVRLWRVGTRQAARRVYLYSMLYLFLLFIAMAVDRVVGGP